MCSDPQTLSHCSTPETHIVRRLSRKQSKAPQPGPGAWELKWLVPAPSACLLPVQSEGACLQLAVARGLPYQSHHRRCTSQIPQSCRSPREVPAAPGGPGGHPLPADVTAGAREPLAASGESAPDLRSCACSEGVFLAVVNRRLILC